jgi:hypothetical protein
MVASVEGCSQVDHGEPCSIGLTLNMVPAVVACAVPPLTEAVARTAHAGTRTYKGMALVA